MADKGIFFYLPDKQQNTRTNDNKRIITAKFMEMLTGPKRY